MRVRRSTTFLLFFFFNDTATTEIYTLSLHDALPIWRRLRAGDGLPPPHRERARQVRPTGSEARHRPRLWRHPTPPPHRRQGRSEEHTSELQSQSNLVCRLLLEIKTTTFEHQPY